MIYGIDYFGFIYLWFDRKHRRFYLGSHMGAVDDGYVCSCDAMRKAYRRNPQDFKRRILWYIRSDDMLMLREEEDRLLKTLKDDEISPRGKKNKYYNGTRYARLGGGKEFLSEQAKLYHSNSENKEQHRTAVSKAWTPERKAAHAAKVKARWESGNYKARDNAIKTEEGRERHRQAAKNKRISQSGKDKISQKNQKQWEITHPDGKKEVIANLLQWSKDRGLSLYGGRKHRGYSARLLD